MNKGYFTDVDDDTMRLGTFYYAGGIYYILRQWLTEPINKTPQEGAFAYSKDPFLHTLLFQSLSHLEMLRPHQNRRKK